jgi:hypothetical protein
MYPDWEVSGALLQGAVGVGIGPFAQSSLDGVLGLAVCSGRVGLGADVAPVQDLAALFEKLRRRARSSGSQTCVTPLPAPERV